MTAPAAATGAAQDVGAFRCAGAAWPSRGGGDARVASSFASVTVSSESAAASPWAARRRGVLSTPWKLVRWVLGSGTRANVVRKAPTGARAPAYFVPVKSMRSRVPPRVTSKSFGI